jgi:hypothetical protein
MPSYSRLLFTFALISAVWARPTPQLAGEGQAADSLFTDTDNGVGFGIKNAEDGVASLITSVKGGSVGSTGGSTAPPPPPPPPHKGRRQLAGEGQAADSVFTDTDNGVGYGIKNAEDNLAATLGGGATTTGGSSAPPPPPPPKEKRQLDKISNGFQDISNAAGSGSSTTGLTGALDTVDGDLTSGAANAGASVGGTEESTLKGLGNAVPKTKRQLDKISNGFQDVSNALGTGSSSTTLTGALDTVDGDLTSGAANAGASTGGTEASTLEEAGNAVPKV